MPIEIRMPRLVDSMTHGAVVVWRTREGERVMAGDVIAEIEIDKTTADLEAPDAGTLIRIEVPAGSEKVEVGTVLAILEPGGRTEPDVMEDSLSPSHSNTRPLVTGTRSSRPSLARIRALPRSIRYRRNLRSKSMPVPWPGAWPVRSGSTLLLFTAAARLAASSWPTS